MSKTPFLLAAVVAVLLGLFSISSCTDAGSSPPPAKVSDDEASALQLRLLRAGEIEAAKAAQIPEVTASGESAGSRASFSLTSTITGSGKPLPGVRITLTALWSSRKYQLISGENGVATIEGVIPGHYEVVLSHVTHAPLKASYGPRRVIRLPAPSAACQWAEVYVAGWSAVGSESLAPLGRVRYQELPSLDQTGEVSRDDFEAIVQRLRARWGDYVHVCVPRPDAPSSRTVTIFDEKKGPCQFELPLMPLSEFRERTECDLSSKPVVEAMSRLTITVVDAAGNPVDIGRIGIARESDYFGYRKDRLFGNTAHVVPPGRYQVSTAGMVYPWQLPDLAVELEPGKSADLKIQLPHPMREVVLIVPGPGAIARVLAREAQGKPISIRGRHRLWLPQGVTKMSFLYVPKDARRSARVQRDLTVEATEGLQHITVPLD